MRATPGDARFSASRKSRVTVIRPGGTCTKPDPNTPTTSYTWHGESFTLTTTNGTSGMLEASLPYEYTSVLGNGSCTMKFTGPVTKQ